MLAHSLVDRVSCASPNSGRTICTDLDAFFHTEIALLENHGYVRAHIGAADHLAAG
jgi:hypothetical protein